MFPIVVSAVVIICAIPLAYLIAFALIEVGLNAIAAAVIMTVIAAAICYPIIRAITRDQNSPSAS